MLASLGYTEEVAYPDISTKEKAQKLIGLDIPKEREAKNKFNETVLPEWRKQADQREKSYSN